MSKLSRTSSVCSARHRQMSTHQTIIIACGLVSAGIFIACGCGSHPGENREGVGKIAKLTQLCSIREKSEGLYLRAKEGLYLRAKACSRPNSAAHIVSLAGGPQSSFQAGFIRIYS